MPPDIFSIQGFADPFSSLSHLLGAAVFSGLSFTLVRKGWRARHPPRLGAHGGRVASLVIFAFSAVLLLSLSGVYHLLGHHAPARAVLQRLDHAAIFILIAGTATPIHTIMFRGPLRWGILGFMWTLAGLGVTLKSIYFNDTPESLGLILYVGMGWFGGASMIAIARRFGFRKILPLFLGGIAYTLGAAIELIEPTPLIAGVIRAHELFHVFVLLGLALHWRFIWNIADQSGQEL
ncbi:MAG: hemolysin III family protein [Pyrinomonadaceae bacterium]|nr:hemolysin III family protein [Phycisphaerales bacterium]